MAKSPSRNMRPRCGPFSGSACSAAGVDTAIALGATTPVNEIIIAKLNDDRIFLFFISLLMVLLAITNGHAS